MLRRSERSAPELRPHEEGAAPQALQSCAKFSREQLRKRMLTLHLIGKLSAMAKARAVGRLGNRGTNVVVDGEGAGVTERRFVIVDQDLIEADPFLNRCRCGRCSLSCDLRDQR